MSAAGRLPETDLMDPAMFWDVLRERDDYRSRAYYAAHRIEKESGQVRDADGVITALVLPIEVWRSVRAMLEREHAADQVSRPGQQAPR